jgi:hypothetical protein
MKILRHKETGELLPHPRNDGQPAAGLNPIYEEFWLVDMQPPQLAPQETAEQFDEVDERAKTITRGWRILRLPDPPPPGPDYLSFWDAVLVSQTYAELLGRAMVSLPVNTALTAFIAAFQDAKQGRPNVGAIQACIGLVLGAAADVLKPEHLEELQELMDTHRLAGTFRLSP